MLSQQSGVVVTENIWPAKLTISTLRPLRRKLAEPRSRMAGAVLQVHRENVCGRVKPREKLGQETTQGERHCAPDSGGPEDSVALNLTIL